MREVFLVPNSAGPVPALSLKTGASMKPEILLLLPIFAPTLAVLEQRYVVHKLWAAADREALFREVAPRVRGIVTTGLAGCDAATMQALPKLEIIACFGSSRHTLDVAVAKARGVVCTRTPDAITESVADLALGLMLDVMRRIAAGDRFMINVARGAVVNEQALITALQEKRIAGAGLDVFWDEPRVPAALLAMDNVVLVPHIGTSTQEVRVERGRKVLANLQAHFAGQAVPYPV